MSKYSECNLSPSLNTHKKPRFLLQKDGAVLPHQN